MAKKGSLHGYDILDHNRINPEIGTEEEYDEFVQELRKYGMGQILDIVPNHMSIAGNENSWWMDVLENGPSSVYADFFDIDWNPVKVELENKVLLPILGDQYGRVLENQELNLSLKKGHFSSVTVIENYLSTLFLKDIEIPHRGFRERMGKDHPDLQELFSIVTALTHLPHAVKRREKILERQREKEVIKRRLWNLYRIVGRFDLLLMENVLIFNGEKGNPRSFDLLDELLNDQAYRLSHWRVATEEINYRRFFDINELAAIRIENLDVFREVHNSFLS